MKKLIFRHIAEIESFMEAFDYFKPRIPEMHSRKPVAGTRTETRPSTQFNQSKPSPCYAGNRAIFVSFFYDIHGKLIKMPLNGVYTGVKYKTETLIVRSDGRLARPFTGETAEAYEVQKVKVEVPSEESSDESEEENSAEFTTDALF